MSCAAHALANSRGFLLEADVDLIQDLCKNLIKEDPIVLDIGAGSGTTALSVLCVKPKAKVISLDISAEALRWTGLAIENAGFSSQWQGIDLAMHIVPDADLVLDALLIDGDHSYKAVKKNVKFYWPLLRLGGFVWLHDYSGPDPDSEGVKRAVDEFAEELSIIGRTSGYSWACRKI